MECVTVRHDQQDVGRLQVAVDDARAGGRRARPGPASRPAGRRRGRLRACRRAARPGCRPRRTPGRGTAGRRARRPRRSARCCGCCSRATASASARKRARSLGVAAAPARIIFRATDPVAAGRCAGLVDDAHAAAAELAEDLVPRRARPAVAGGGRAPSAGGRAAGACSRAPRARGAPPPIGAGTRAGRLVRGAAARVAQPPPVRASADGGQLLQRLLAARHRLDVGVSAAASARPRSVVEELPAGARAGGQVFMGRRSGGLTGRLQPADLVLDHLLHPALGHEHLADLHAELRGRLRPGQALQRRQPERLPGVRLDPQPRPAATACVQQLAVELLLQPRRQVVAGLDRLPAAARRPAVAGPRPGRRWPVTKSHQAWWATVFSQPRKLPRRVVPEGRASARPA